MKVGIGQDSHKFDFGNKRKKLILGGVIFENHAPLLGNSDSDVVLHALVNAISGVTCKNILGTVTDRMCKKDNITDSEEYVKEALKYMGTLKILHVSFSIECKTPAISPKIEEMRKSISDLLGISGNCIGITATTGEGMTLFGEGKGVQVFCCLTVV